MDCASHQYEHLIYIQWIHREHFTNVPDTPHESLGVHEPEESGDAEDRESQMKPSKRKRMSPVQTSNRLTRSMSSVHKKSQGDQKAARIVPGRGRKRKLLDSGSDHGSASSGASTTAKLLQFTSANGSRASSIVSSAPSDSSSIQHPPPLFHAHGAMHHRHRLPPLPSASVRTHSTKIASPDPSHNPERQKDYSSGSTLSRAPSSNVQRFAALTSSPVTRSNCRFHKISLPKEEGGPRVCFVVPGCSLGDKELMDEEEIQDHGPATHEDYSRLVGNIEALDFNPYLVGILRQLVGVDLIRENEVFFLLQPGEEAQYKKKKGRKSTAGLKLSASLSQSATTSPQVSVASRRSPMTTISRPPVSTAGSIATSFSSSLSEVQLYSTSSLFSASGGESSDEEGSSPKLKRRRKESVPDKETRADVERGTFPQDPLSKNPQRSTHILKRRQSKRQVVDSAAYKPHTEDVEGPDSGADGLGKDRRKMKKIRRNKRSHVADEEQDSQAKRQKQLPTE
ncbi:hypothetical protein C8R48DRAFT_220621 [Suillus tomentosus]|nr:hypothetical protein C8R48DRAFT_220621 [Suillus tomentosus]